MKHRIRLASPAGILVVLPLLALSRPTSGAMRQEQTVLAGIELHLETGRSPDTVIFRRSVTRAGVDSVTGTRAVITRILTGASGRRLLEVVQRFPGGGGEIVDTAVSELSTLRPISHRSHQPTKTMRFDFAGTEVTGSVVESPTGDGASRVQDVHQSLGKPTFDSNVLELVVSALPLERDFTAELPLFIYERGGRVPALAAVQERARVEFPALGTRDAWVVTLALPGAPATIWVDVTTRAVLRTRYDIEAQRMSFTDDRITALPARTAKKRGEAER